MACNDYFKSSSRPSLGGDGWQRSYPVNTYPSMIQTLLAGQRPDYGVLPCGWLPLDIDTFATQGCRGTSPC